MKNTNETVFVIYFYKQWQKRQTIGEARKKTLFPNNYLKNIEMRCDTRYKARTK